MLVHVIEFLLARMQTGNHKDILPWREFRITIIMKQLYYTRHHTFFSAIFAQNVYLPCTAAIRIISKNAQSCLCRKVICCIIREKIQHAYINFVTGNDHNLKKSIYLVISSQCIYLECNCSTCKAIITDMQQCPVPTLTCK